MGVPRHSAGSGRVERVKNQPKFKAKSKKVTFDLRPEVCSSAVRITPARLAALGDVGTRGNDAASGNGDGSLSSVDQAVTSLADVVTSSNASPRRALPAKSRPKRSCLKNRKCPSIVAASEIFSPVPECPSFSSVLPLSAESVWKVRPTNTLHDRLDSIKICAKLEEEFQSLGISNAERHLGTVDILKGNIPFAKNTSAPDDKPGTLAASEDVDICNLIKHRHESVGNPSGGDTGNLPHLPNSFRGHFRLG